jgi:hypothetical protein
MMHYAVRDRAAESIGQGQAQALIMKIVEDLKQKFGDRLGAPPAG